jgi:hypothetical protein
MLITFEDGTTRSIDRSEIAQVCLSSEIGASGMQSKTHRSRNSNTPPTNIRSKNVIASQLAAGDVLITAQQLRKIARIER